ncbi:MAG: hypothetical protein AB8H79_19350 [Myxococcota bacterium]
MRIPAMVILMLATPQLASAQSYLDRFSTKPVAKAAPAASRTASATPNAAGPIAQPAVTPAAVEAQDLTPATSEPAQAVIIDKCLDASTTCLDTSAQLIGLEADLLAMEARLAALEAQAETDAPDSPAATPATTEWDPTTTLSLSVGSAYNFRGSNYFAGDDGYGGLLAPGLSVDLPHGFSIGWWAAFQIAGSNRSDMILNGSGNEQDLIIGWSTDLSDRVSFSAGAVAYIYPFATKTAAGATAPVWLEPGVSLDVDLGVTWSTYLGHNQGLQRGIAQGSYTYANTGLSHSIPLDDRLSIDAGASAGIKGWRHGDAWRPNTLDLGADLGLGISLGDLSLAPGAHLVWTNTAPEASTDATFIWAGIDASLTY